MPAFDTADLSAATRALSDEYSDLAISPTRPGFGMRLTSTETGAVRVADLTLSHACIRTRPLAAYVVALPVAGRVVASTARDGRVGITAGTGIVSTAGREVTVDYDGRDYAVLTAQFDKRALEDELAALLGHQLTAPLDFAFRLPGEVTALRRVIELMRDDVGPVALKRRMDSLAMAALLFGQRHNYSDELSAPVGLQGPRSIRDAVAAVEERPLDIVTVADLARVSHLSVRALEAGFRRHVGMPPMAYVREIRMRRVHEELLAADASETTATEVAARWGFAHYGRFAASYRERFGLSPGATLRH